MSLRILAALAAALLAGCSASPDAPRQISFFGLQVELEQADADTYWTHVSEARQAARDWRGRFERELAVLDRIPNFFLLGRAYGLSEPAIGSRDDLLGRRTIPTGEVRWAFSNWVNAFHVNAHTTSLRHLGSIDGLRALLPPKGADADARRELAWLTRYYAEFFRGRFVDRNGLRLPFDDEARERLTAGLERLGHRGGDRPDVAPAIAGRLVRVLGEYAGDRVAGVPVYAPEVFAGAALAQIDTRRAAQAAIVRDAPIEDGLRAAPGRVAMLRLDELDRRAAVLLRQGEAAGQGRYANTPHRTGVIAGVLGVGDHVIVCRDGEQAHDMSRLVGELIQLAAVEADEQAHSAMGGAIRGGNLGSLSNEVVAEMVGHMGGVMARKVTEKLVYELLVRVIASDWDFTCTVSLPGSGSCQLDKCGLLIALERIVIDGEDAEVVLQELAGR